MVLMILFISGTIVLGVVMVNEGHTTLQSDECQTKKANLLVLPWEWAHLDNPNDTLQLTCEFQVTFPLVWIKAQT